MGRDGGPGGLRVLVKNFASILIKVGTRRATMIQVKRTLLVAMT